MRRNVINCFRDHVEKLKGKDAKENRTEMAKVKKRASKFVKLLSRKIKDEGSSSGRLCDKGTLKSLFNDALKELPPGQLRDEIQNNAAIYKQKLKQCLSSVSLPTVNKSTDVSNSKFVYNLYKTKQHKCFGANKHADNLFLCKVLASKDVDSLAKLLSNVDEDHIELRLLSITTGGKSLAILEKIMHVYFLKSQPYVEKLLEEKNSKRCIKMADEVRHFLTVCHLRHSSMEKSTTTALVQYVDLVASLAAVYVDLCLVAYRSLDKHEQLSRRLCNICCYLTSGQPEFRLEILLQLTVVTETDADVLLLFVRKCLELKPEQDSCRHYLKYVLAVRQLHQLLKSSLPDDVLQECRTVPAPVNFLDWLREQNPDVLEEIPEDRKFKKRIITNFLLDEISEETDSGLMDILTVKVKQGLMDETKQGSKPELTAVVDTEAGWKTDKGSENLFFIDTKGAKDKQEKDNKTADNNKESSDDDVIFESEEFFELEDDEDIEVEEEQMDDDEDMSDSSLVDGDESSVKTSALVEQTLQEVEDMLGKSTQSDTTSKTTSHRKLERSERKPKKAGKLSPENLSPQTPSQNKTNSKPMRSGDKRKNNDKHKVTVQSSLVNGRIEVFNLTQLEAEQPAKQKGANQTENVNSDLMAGEQYIESKSDSGLDESETFFTGIEHVSDSAESDDDHVVLLPNLALHSKSDIEDLNMSRVVDVVTDIGKSPSKRPQKLLSEQSPKTLLKQTSKTPSIQSPKQSSKQTKNTPIQSAKTPIQSPKALSKQSAKTPMQSPETPSKQSAKTPIQSPEMLSKQSPKTPSNQSQETKSKQLQDTTSKHSRKTPLIQSPKTPSMLSSKTPSPSQKIPSIESQKTPLIRSSIASSKQFTKTPSEQYEGTLLKYYTKILPEQTQEPLKSESKIVRHGDEENVQQNSKRKSTDTNWQENGSPDSKQIKTISERRSRRKTVEPVDETRTKVFTAKRGSPSKKRSETENVASDGIIGDPEVETPSKNRKHRTRSRSKSEVSCDDNEAVSKNVVNPQEKVMEVKEMEDKCKSLGRKTPKKNVKQTVKSTPAKGNADDTSTLGKTVYDEDFTGGYSLRSLRKRTHSESSSYCESAISKTVRKSSRHSSVPDNTITEGTQIRKDSAEEKTSFKDEIMHDDEDFEIQFKDTPVKKSMTSTPRSERKSVEGQKPSSTRTTRSTKYSFRVKTQ